MNWWKLSANSIDNFEDRNRANHAIHWLESASKTLNYLTELVFMTNRGARKMANELISSKEFSSYPMVMEFVEQACVHALDNPYKFAALCRQAANRLISLKEDLIEERTLFVNEKTTKPMKGWLDE